MQIIRKHPTNYMKDIVVPDCNCKEYYGMTIMRDSINYCRKCMYEIWQKENGYQGWKPEPNKDFIFPLYSDGIDYTKEEK